MLRVVVLGAGAGGGVPQWNCGCEAAGRPVLADMSFIEPRPRLPSAATASTGS